MVNRLKFSLELHKYLENAFSPHFERSFLLFEKDGIICKAIESTKPNTPRSFNFDPEHTEESFLVMQKEGYNLVGHYHYHLDSDAEIAFRRNPPKKKIAYNLGMKYNPDQPSPDDLGVFKLIGTNPSKRDDPVNLRVQDSIQYLFLGHRSESIPFHIKVYTPGESLDTLPENHPLRKDKNPRYLDHYKNNTQILESELSLVKTNDQDVSAESILRKHNLRFRKHEFRIGKMIIKLYTKDNKISMLEVYSKNYCKRYVFENQKLTRVILYGDNTTGINGFKIKFYEKESLRRLEKEVKNILNIIRNKSNKRTKRRTTTFRPKRQPYKAKIK